MATSVGVHTLSPTTGYLLRHGRWPATSRSYRTAIHDLRHYQDLLDNQSNFTQNGESECDIMEFDEDGIIRRTLNVSNDQIMSQYLAQANKQDQRIACRAIFCAIRNTPFEGNTSFNQQSSLSSSILKEMMGTFDVSPAFLVKLVGEPDYWSTNFVSTVINREPNIAEGIQVITQHPRWNIHIAELPISVWLGFDNVKKCATYIVSGQHNSLVVQRIKERLSNISKTSDDIRRKGGDMKSKIGMPDPLMLHTLITHVGFDMAKARLHGIRTQLYDVLDQVDKFASGCFDDVPNKRQMLSAATVELSNVSQSLDSKITYVAMALSNVEALIDADRKVMKMIRIAEPASSHEQSASLESLIYLRDSLHAQSGGLKTWKARKETAMNLVFNLVTQQDAGMAVLTVQAAQVDASQMKAIATLTMVFLPGTYIATLFCIPQLKDTSWSTYWMVTGPLTCGILIVWFLWIWRRLILDMIGKHRSVSALHELDPLRYQRWPTQRRAHNTSTEALSADNYSDFSV